MAEDHHRLWAAFVATVLPLTLAAAVCFGDTPYPARRTSVPADRYVADAVFFIAEHRGEAIRAMLSFSRGVTDIGGHRYAAECTAHLFRRGEWTHLGPGLYDCPETTLAAIPPGPNFDVTRSEESPHFSVTFTDRACTFRLDVERLDSLSDLSESSEYLVQYSCGRAVLAIDTDTIPGHVIFRHHDFTGYNRLAGNVRGYFPGQHDFAALTGTDGSSFIFSYDPVQRHDTDARIHNNFAAYRLADGRRNLALDSVSTQWIAYNDSLYPGKPVPRLWNSTIAHRRWSAQYRDVGHFFYFTGFGLFAVGGDVTIEDTVYHVTGIVEHIHAREKSR